MPYRSTKSIFAFNKGNIPDSSTSYAPISILLFQIVYLSVVRSGQAKQERKQASNFDAVSILDWTRGGTLSPVIDDHVMA